MSLKHFQIIQKLGINIKYISQVKVHIQQYTK